MFTPGSPEQALDTRLRNLGGCAIRNFTEIANALNIRIANSTLAQALSGRSRLDEDTAQRLIDLVGELEEIQHQFFDVPIHWANAERVSNAVVLRRLARYAAEDRGDHSFDAEAQRATQSVTQAGAVCQQ